FCPVWAPAAWARSIALGTRASAATSPSKFSHLLSCPIEGAACASSAKRECLRRSNHPSIAAIYGIEEIEGRLALVLELVDGPTLAGWTQKATRRSVPECLAIARQIADGLEAAHAKGIVHRDLKPTNVQVTAERVAKIIDFGIAKATPSEG